MFLSLLLYYFINVVKMQFMISKFSKARLQMQLNDYMGEV